MKSGLHPCHCGHSIEEHVDDHFPGSSSCGAEGCECIAYEADESDDDELSEDSHG